MEHPPETLVPRVPSFNLPFLTNRVVDRRESPRRGDNLSHNTLLFYSPDKNKAGKRGAKKRDLSFHQYCTPGTRRGAEKLPWNAAIAASVPKTVQIVYIW